MDGLVIFLDGVFGLLFAPEFGSDLGVAVGHVSPQWRFWAQPCVPRVGFAIWSRHVLARSWNHLATLRDGHALLTQGRYSIVRHPIYFGFILLAIGLIVVLLEVRALVLLVDIVVFFRKIKPEESILRATYPKQYPEYEKRVKRLFPCTWQSCA